MRTQVICLALAIVLLSPFAPAQWVQTNGPYGGRISCFASSGAYLFAGTNDGYVFRTSDGGTTWTNLNHNGLATRSGILTAGISALLENGPNLVASAVNDANGGIYVSTDNGDHWVNASNGLGRKDITCLVSNGSSIFAGRSNVGGGAQSLYRSTDNGSTWIPVGIGMEYPPFNIAPVYALAMCDEKLLAGSRGIFLSTNNGDSWIGANVGFPVDQDGFPPFVTSFLVHGGSLYAGTSLGIFVSTNSGVTWAVVDTSGERRYVKSFSAVVGDMFVSTGSAVFRTTDKGSSWSSVVQGLVGDVGPLVSAGTNLYAGTGIAGVFLSTDLGTSWTLASNGMEYLPVTALESNAGKLVAGTYAAGVFLSTNSGNTWTAANGGISGACLGAGSDMSNSPSTRHAATSGPLKNGAIPIPPRGIFVKVLLRYGSYLFAGTKNGLFRTSDEGASWTSVIAPSRFPEVNSLASSGMNLFAVWGVGGQATQSDGVFVSSDSGVNWTAASNGLPRPINDSTIYEYISFLLPSGGNLFAGAGRVYVTSNNGGTWTAASSGLPSDVYITCLANSGARLIAGTGWHGPFLSTDGGHNWIGANEGFPKDVDYPEKFAWIASLAPSGQNIFAATSYYDRGHTYVSTTGGSSWIAVDDGLPQEAVNAIIASGTNLFAGIGYPYSLQESMNTGVWRRPLSEMTPVRESAASVPNSYTFQQNYPNPFNPSTTIRYGLPERSHVSLMVYNTLGQQVAQLVSGEVEAGYHEVTFDASRLPTGIYFYRLQAGSYTEVKKLVLMK
jgi:photosystem II stability/assembly factor-like uncharacterized protein